MSSDGAAVVLIGEVYIDVTLAGSGQENKLRLGGVVHAARGLWAAGIGYEAGVFAPSYVYDNLAAYLSGFGCVSNHILGEIGGSPNVILIGDPAEVGHQGYETLLRDEKVVDFQARDMAWVQGKDVVIFPGRYDWQELIGRLREQSPRHPPCD